MKLRRLLDALSVYMPLIVLALLASGSWWLVRSVPSLSSTLANKPVRQDPDYRLSQFSVKSFNKDGQMTREVSGESAQHFPATDALHIEKIRIFSQNEKNDRMDAQAQQGIASDDGTQITLLGRAQAIQYARDTRPQIELHGERLVALPDEDKVVSDDPVRIIRGRDVFTADSMNFNSHSGEYLLQGRVKGSVMPKTSKP
ncbi:LPS export ABC transporter periplasmic protein LptC [Limnohabitans sp. G3-2]|uniref:LPS export ABC transporter periplasmic protein LptC n=1 Tax=Limnohabitans sp. G3-2 TaxID=1100711 RepID=UPI000C1EA689|nr:LPS export ABC transporter periplasmic protein LptC [Limnohabitans sp. G3-2]PIT76955.1 LPS export ABC transporter periplasmic protein LptC [Limnohabitans sp. G3-2]